MAITYGEALSCLGAHAASAGSLPEHTVAIQNAVGAVCAETVFSTERLPRYTNAAVDGFSVSAAAVMDGSTLPVRGLVIAGDTPIRGERDAACAIMTGAPVPEWHDAVVKIEEVTPVRDAANSIVTVTLPGVRAGQHLRLAGADFVPGTSVIGRGERLRPAHVLALSALGIATVRVRQAPRIAVIATGGELAQPTAAPGPGQIRNATSPYLSAALRAFGADVYVSAAVGDDPAAFRDTLDRLLTSRPDVVITTGAVSMGVHDFVPSVVTELGGDIVFHRVAIRPGGPLLFATLRDGTPLFALPGNPLSTVVGARFFLMPYLRQRLGMPDERPTRARLASAVHKPDGLRCFFRGITDATHDAPAQVTLFPHQESFRIRPLLEANAWAILTEPESRVAAGTWVDVFPIEAHD